MRTLFPNGMRALEDYIHSLGLKAGIGDNVVRLYNSKDWMPVIDGMEIAAVK